jgi:hypothetical protein
VAELGKLVAAVIETRQKLHDLDTTWLEGRKTKLINGFASQDNVDSESFQMRLESELRLLFCFCDNSSRTYLNSKVTLIRPAMRSLGIDPSWTSSAIVVAVYGSQIEPLLVYGRMKMASSLPNFRSLGFTAIGGSDK